MLTRPGSAPGSGWMRNVSDRLASGPADPRSLPRRYWISYIAFMSLVLVILPLVQRRAMPSYDVRSYESSTRIGGLPLFASGATPVAIIAVGGRPRGVIAVGGIAVGVIAVGGLAAGGLAFGGLSPRFISLAGIALRWGAIRCRALPYSPVRRPSGWRFR